MLCGSLVCVGFYNICFDLFIHCFVMGFFSFFQYFLTEKVFSFFGGFFFHRYFLFFFFLAALVSWICDFL